VSAARGPALVIGASGQVGRHAAAALAADGHQVTGTYATHPSPGLVPLDLLDSASIRRLVRSVQPEVCVLASALTNVDRCQDEPAQAHALNARAAGVVAAACRETGGKLVYLSTEYVFDGTAGPYAEDDPTGPLNVYGATKLAGEAAVLTGAPDALVLRTTVVFSHDPAGRNFIMQLRERLGRGERMRIPADQRSSPTYAPDLGAALAALVRRGAAGVLHVAGPEVLDRYAFARMAARALGLDAGLLEPVPTRALAQRASRPLQAGLRIDRLRALLGDVTLGPEAALRQVAEAIQADGPGRRPPP
jgi:dTDP-4-dehydrorhamnose reductase